MTDKIGGIRRVSFTSGRVEKVRNYTAKERAEKLKEIDRAAAERAEVREYLSRYPNPDHLSFAELLELAIHGKTVTDNDLDYILDIGKPVTEEPGYTVTIGGHDGK